MRSLSPEDGPQVSRVVLPTALILLLSALTLLSSGCAVGQSGPASTGEGSSPDESGRGVVGEAEESLRVLILTGDDYPGHLWQLTTPVLRAGLEADSRFSVTVVERPQYLGDPGLFDHDVVVLHWMNWEKPDPGSSARDGLRRFVEGGKGLVLVHFACGAFQDWPEFRNLAGRVYDPELPPHDPYGEFRVEVVRPEHPVVRDLDAFETTDELYTCLAGERPVQVLATARSKVTGEDAPMALAHSYGKGRVFQTPLGHDVAALENPGTRELLRRGVAWAGGISPTVAPDSGAPAEPAGANSQKPSNEDGP